jgi:SAM-dependent methyltransferase
VTGDRWTGGADYDAYVGRWSRPVAAAFVDWLSVGPGRDWVDVGCGTGALSTAILDTAGPASVVGIDPSADFVRAAAARIADPRAGFVVGSAGAIPLDTAAADAVVSGLVLNFIPDPGAGLAEMVRVTRPTGTVAAYVWDYAGGMELIRRFWDAAVALDPAAREVDEGTRFPICAPGPLQRTFESAGLAGVEVRPIDVPTEFRDFDDYWRPFLSGVGPAPGYAVALTAPHREALRARLEATLPRRPDGRIALVARAWAVRGRRSRRSRRA